MRSTLLFPFIFSLLFGCFTSVAYGQKDVTTFGIQFKPIIPNRIIGTYEEPFNEGNFESTVKQGVGTTFGMVIRRGITKSISFETGLSFTQRNFNLDFAVPDSGFSSSGRVGFIAYEIPFSALYYIRLGESFYLNTSLGAAFNYFPSDISKEFNIGFNQYFLQEGARLNRIQGSVIANLGFEYRTKNKGYFYVGSSYNLPFAPIVTFAMSHEYPPENTLSIQNILGSYLTLDLRYYFNEKPDSQ